jgi:hypothetical protein
MLFLGPGALPDNLLDRHCFGQIIRLPFARTAPWMHQVCDAARVRRTHSSTHALRVAHLLTLFVFVFASLVARTCVPGKHAGPGGDVASIVARTRGAVPVHMTSVIGADPLVLDILLDRAVQSVLLL